MTGEESYMNKDLRICENCDHPRIVGHAFTRYICKSCNQEKEWHNTGTPTYCPDCSQKLNRCGHCGQFLGQKVYNPTKKNVLYMLKESNLIEDVHDNYALINAHRAWKYVMRYEKLNNQIIKETHRLLMVGQPIAPKYRGDWRDVPVWIGGVKKDQPKIVIDSLMRDWCARTNKVGRNFDPVTLHIAFEDIHPFIDGNGRMGRILLNWHLVQRNKAPLLIYTDAEKYDVYYPLFQKHLRWEKLMAFHEAMGTELL
jgi:fido (protein-threonine AMPylation protein)